MNERIRSSRIPESALRVSYYRAPESADDPLIRVAHMVADAIVAVGGPLFSGVLGIGLLTSLFR